MKFLLARKQHSWLLSGTSIADAAPLWTKRIFGLKGFRIIGCPLAASTDPKEYPGLKLLVPTPSPAMIMTNITGLVKLFCKASVPGSWANSRVP